MKHLKLSDNCVLVNWDVSLLYNLESIEIGNIWCYRKNGDAVCKEKEVIKKTIFHFSYQIVNHWNRLKLVNVVSVILLETLK